MATVAPGVLTNATDADGDTIIAQLVSGPTNGTDSPNATVTSPPGQ